MQRRKAAVQVIVHLDVGEFTVVEPGAFEPGVIQLETERLNQVQAGARIGA